MRRGRVIGVIQARIGSSRFPGKMMALLRDRPIIAWVLERVRRARRLDEVVLAIPEGRRDDVLEAEGARRGIRVLRGSETDVLSRFVRAAIETEAAWIVRVCADNPLVDPEEIDRLVAFALAEPVDYAFNHRNRLNNQYPDGLGAEIVSRRLLERMDCESATPELREHATLYVWRHPATVRIGTFPCPPAIAFPELRFDVDDPADLEKLERYLRRVADETDARADVFSIRALEIVSAARLPRD